MVRAALLLLHFRCCPPRRRGIQYAAAPIGFHKFRCGVLDRPIKSGDDTADIAGFARTLPHVHPSSIIET
ncbi:hypothetical protein EAS61_36145 [Bradyrhizobium zhanjiangense]|uniref:Uncharacterized protein n=1 Tax=Bradyrhizobium zhanjiangense TaxID=1325107 RepID=A0A4Q0QA07_9BRAD|nr:hypothetical protein EAS61_36145 [Bradyrhizobium zhanjiangense]